MKAFFLKYQYPILFCILLLSLGLAYGYQDIFHYTPRSTHQWRQTDSASAALSYYRDGLNFFKPRMHYVMGGDGYVTGAGEAPIFYYLVAVFYSIFGPHEGIFRLLCLLTLAIGLYLMGRIIKTETGDWFSALLPFSFIMASPLVAFYGFNFVPNVPAQGLAMVGIWFFYLYGKKQELRFFYWSMLFYSLAGLIKISALMSFVVILGVYGVELVGLFKFRQGQRIFKDLLRVIPGFLLVLAAIFGWKLWADHFNEVHQCSYFLSKTKPIWELDAYAKQHIWERIVNIWVPVFYHHYLLYGLGGIGLIALLTPRRQPPILYFSFWLIVIGCTGFLLLWYRQFDHHDYYALEMMLVPVGVITFFLLVLKRYFPRFLQHWVFRLSIIAFLLYNVNYAKDIVQLRYQPDTIFMKHFNPTLYKNHEIQAFLKGLGIAYPDKVISAPDQSPNNTLYVYNLIGWTELYMGRSMTAAKVIALSKEGAKYLIISDPTYLEHEELKSVLIKPMGSFENSIFVFDVRGIADEIVQ